MRQPSAAQTLIDVRVGAFKRMEEGNRKHRLRGGALARRFLLAEEPGRAPQAERVIAGTADRDHSGGNRNDRRSAVNHSRNSSMYLNVLWSDKNLCTTKDTKVHEGSYS